MDKNGVYNTADPITYGVLKEFARKNRNNPTDAERQLWDFLKNKFEGIKFRRQHIIDMFIVDFVCLSKQVVIEVDGKYHNTKEQQEHDKMRTKRLQELGFTELRYTNEDVLFHLFDVINEITEYINK